MLRLNISQNRLFRCLLEGRRLNDESPIYGSRKAGKMESSATMVLTARFLREVIREVAKSLLIAGTLRHTLALYPPFLPREYIRRRSCRWINYLIIHGFIIIAGRLTSRSCRRHLSREISSFHHLSRPTLRANPLSISESLADVDAFVSLPPPPRDIISVHVLYMCVRTYTRGDFVCAANVW